MGSEFRSQNLIFLLSQQRAGSTLLQRILGGHPEIHTTAEPWLMLHPIYALRPEGHQAEYNAWLAYKALQDFLGTLDGGRAHYVEALRRMALYLYGTACDQAGKAYFLDKTPRYFYVIPELARVFPRARFIVLLRNPLAVLSSVLETWVKDHWILLARYRQDLVDAPKRLLEGIDLLGDRAIVVHYEAVVEDPGGQVEVLCRQLGLDFYPDMIEYGRGPRPEGSMGDPTGVDKQVRPTAGSLDRWLEMGRNRQTKHFAVKYLHTLGPEIVSGLGYNYADLEAALQAVPSTEGKIKVRWHQVVNPEPRLKKRLVSIELALLEHRRLVHALRRWKSALRGPTRQRRGRQ
jgi:hypothetical protein